MLKMSSGFDIPPNGLPISRRERVADHLQKAHDLAREAVGCIGVFGGKPISL
jgi:hypothetical protein